MQTPLRLLAIPAAVAAVCSVLVAAIVLTNNRPTILVTGAASSTSTTPETAILTSGDATVSVKPDLAIVSAGVDSQASTAAAAQSDLARKASQLIARVKALGVGDNDVTTSGYWLGPVYNSSGQSVSGYRASEQLELKWHTVDSVGRLVDGIVQQGGATNISVSFGLNNPKTAQAQARSQAIGDARSKAEAMASAAGVHVGQVMRISDLSASYRPPVPYDVAASPAAGTVATQVPVGQMDVSVTVEVDFAIS
jgi:uncharacterized protein YggE